MRKRQKRFIGRQKVLCFTAVVTSYGGDSGDFFPNSLFKRRNVAERYNFLFEWRDNVGRDFGEMVYGKLTMRFGGDV